MGAIRSVLPATGTGMAHPGERTALRALADYLSLKPDPGDTRPLATCPGTLVTDWNDNVARSADEVTAAMRAAAEEAP
ncbi:hypothetical protein ACFY97_18530 [Streptomyces klenkii]|uniref:DUF6197 family protein n=1 Tax=Streptomyces klenkii TaxID=1420899 RepID=UPI0036E06E35